MHNSDSPLSGNTKYTTSFYHQHLSGSVNSARLMLQTLFQHFKPASVLDVGCGHGTWLQAVSESGITDFLGLDGHYVDQEALLIDQSKFQSVDLQEPLELNRRFDLVISVEVAEHLPMQRAESFVQDLSNASEVILFSAAVPYQGGEDHLNEQWPEYWGILFRRVGYRCFDMFRPTFWRNFHVESWYAQNAFLFVKEDNPLCGLLSAFSADKHVLSRIHPEIFLINVTRYRPDAPAQLQDELDVWRNVVDAYISGSDEVPTPVSVAGDNSKLQNNPFTQGRLNYRSSADVQTEISAAEADHRAEIFEERRLRRKEHNDVVNTLMNTSVRSQEKLEGENRVLRDRIERLEHRLAEVDSALASSQRAHKNLRIEEAALEQVATLLQALLKYLPSPVKRVLRYVRHYADISYLRSSGYFDEEWYLRENPDVAKTGIDPTSHYVFQGSLDGRNPHPGFNTNVYLANRAKTRRPRRNPFVEYLKWHKGGRLLSAATINAVSSDLTVIPPSPNEPTSTLVTGWYGAKLLSSEQLFEHGKCAMVDSALYTAQTDRIIKRYLTGVEICDSPSATNKRAPLALIREALLTAKVQHKVARSANRATYTIVTSFYEHLAFFARCAESVERLIAADNALGGRNRVEWIILNDDPRVDAVTLHNVLPEAIQPMTRIISDGLNAGISARQNQGIQAANNDWILFLDCDDQLAPNCSAVLDHYIAQFPYCRFISSAIVDIDEDDVELRRRIREWDVGGLYEKGMHAGHLVAMRSDLFSDIGGFDGRFSGCQDYDLALRAAIWEPILLVPDHLYAYRWHSRTQSVSQHKRQARIAEAVKKAFLLHLLDKHWPTEHYAASVLTKDAMGVCLIRTQGHRLDLLEEAVNSVLAQTVCITPCIIVHGNEAVFGVVSQWAQKFANRVQFLHAHLTGRRLGYPLNIGLDFVEQNAEKYDFFCILDDDDIYYPLFSERMVMALSLSASDVVYCTTNSRVPGQQAESVHPPLPTSCLVAGNFIPVNAYVVRTTLLVKSGARMREDIHYLDDWDFFLSLLQAGGKFSLLNETLAEFRIIGDGNTVTKKDPAHFEHCWKIVAARGALVAKHLGMAHFYRDVLNFDFSARPNLSAQCNAHIDAANDIFVLMSEPLKLTDQDR